MIGIQQIISLYLLIPFCIIISIKMDQKGFAISPKMDCPHLKDQDVSQLLYFLTVSNKKHFSELQCNQCKDLTENWICLNCKYIGCSRYVKSHMAQHHYVEKHQITLSFSDASFWCYSCDSYIDSNSLIKARKTLSDAKFASEIGAEKEQEKLVKEMEKMQIKGKARQDFTLEELVEGMKNKKYQKITVLTGAGLSVAAGIPDFRSPGSGLYSKLQKYNLPSPEAVFQINFFKTNPNPFYEVANEFLNGEYQPTLGHKFIKKLDDQKCLYMNLTQNIDDLEVAAGLPEQKLIQAHGHSRSAHCIGCKKQTSKQNWRNALKSKEILKCECGSLVKPDVVFFGEQLPEKFYEAPEIIQNSDLVFIIGSSLAVMPFAFLAHMIKANVPVVLINNTDSIPARSDKLWLKGDIQQSIKMLLEKLDWKI